MGAEVLGRLLREAGFGGGEIRVREMVELVMLGGGAVSTRVPHGWMAASEERCEADADLRQSRDSSVR